MSTKTLGLVCFVLALCMAGAVQADYEETFTDDFSTAHDYKYGDVTGTGWDGMVGADVNETVDKLNANIDSTGELYVQSTGAMWGPDWNPLGPFLYKVVSGDFTATVYVPDYQNINDNDCGIMVRAFPDEAAGPGEDAETIECYPPGTTYNSARTIDDGNEDRWGSLTMGSGRYLKLKRVGNTFYHYGSPIEGLWFSVPGTSVTRDDMAGLPVQVGLWQCTYTPNQGYVTFDNFELKYTVYEEARLPDPGNGATNTSLDQDFTWVAGDLTQDVNGHELYFGTDETAVTDANRTNHPDVNYYVTSTPYYDPGLLGDLTTYYWRVDEVNEPTIWKGDVWSFTTETRKASNPAPTDEAKGVNLNIVLAWSSSSVASSHDVYFGTDEAAVTNAELPAGDVDHDGDVDHNDVWLVAQQWLLDPPVDSLPSADLNGDDNVDFLDWAILANDWTQVADGLFKGNQLSTTFNPGALDEVVEYFWRIDEVNEGRRWKGNTWSFTTLQVSGFYYWPEYSPTLAYDYFDEYGEIDPPTQLCPDGVTGIAGTYTDGWWTFRWGADKNSAVTEDAWIPMLERFNEDFEYITDIMRWPRDKRALEGYYSTIYLYGSGLSTDNAPNDVGGGWQGTHGGYPDVLASYIPVAAFDPNSSLYDPWQQGAMIHEGIHCILSSMPGCKKSCWFHEGGNTWLQGTMEAQRSGNFSSMGWLSAGAAIAPFMPIECYSGWLQDDSFGGPCAQGVGGGSICTWRNLLGGTQYGECFPHALEIILGPKSIAWIWRNCYYSGRVLQDMAEAPGGLGEAQMRRLIQEYRARQAFCDFGQWSYAFRRLLNNNWNVAIQEEWSPYWIDCDVWYATCYVSTTQDGNELTPEYRTLPGWSGANQIPLTIDPGAEEAVVTFNPIGANMSCQLVYRDTGGNIHYGAPISSGACSIPLSSVRNNVIVAVICNTDYIYYGESTRTAKYNYTLTMGAGITGKANINTRWYDYSQSSYTITATSGDNGTISPSGAVSVSAGGSRTFTFNPDPGYEVEEVVLNGLPIGVLDSYTFVNVRGDHSISVTFVEYE